MTATNSPIVFETWDKQTEFIADPTQFVLFNAGIGSGKTRAGAIRALMASQGQVGDRPIRAPNWGIVTAPTFPMLDEAPFPVFLELADPYIAKVRYDKYVVRMKNGSRIVFRSVERPERTLRGGTYSWWWGDEAAMYGPTVWKLAMGRLREFGHLGSAWLTTTPKGRNWMWQRFAAKVRRRYRLINAATWMNPYLEDELLRSWMEEYTGDFALQELGGSFIAHEGLIYNTFDEDTHTTSKVPEGWAYAVAGVDWGSRNPGVILVGAVDGDGNVTIIEEEYKKHRGIDEWVNKAVSLRDQYSIDTFHCDPSEPKYIEAFSSAGLRAVKADNRVRPGIDAVKRLLNRKVGDHRRGLMLHVSAVHTKTEFGQYQWKKQIGDFVPEEPVKANDHALDALRYLVMGAQAPSEAPEMDIRRVL